MKILVVRLSALGDLVHAIPLVAALRASYPGAQIDWLVDERYASLVKAVSGVDAVITVPRVGARAWTGLPRVARELRGRAYDVAIDAQGLIRSAMLARLSRARRVVGFGAPFLREPVARWFYTEAVDVSGAVHVVDKNMMLARYLGADASTWRFPIAVSSSPVVDETRQLLRTRGGISNGAAEHFVLLNAGAAWETKCWPPERYGALALAVLVKHGLPSVVTWGPGEESLANQVVAAARGAAVSTPKTAIEDLMALMQAATVVVAGDTGPLHLAAAVGAPVVGIYGPSNPQRNGPWAAEDETVSAFATCRCQQQRHSAGVVVRRCTQQPRCLDTVEVECVVEAVSRRLAAISAPNASGHA